MAVAPQQVTAYRGPRPVRAVPRTEVSVAPRWLAPLVLVTIDAVALALAALVVGASSTLPLLYLPLALTCLAICGAYRTRITLSALDAAPWLAGRLAIPLLLLAPAACLGGDVAGTLKLALLGTAALVAGRVSSYALLRRVRRHGALLAPAVILGAGEVGTELAMAFRDDRALGIAPVGFLDSVLDDDLPYPLLGDVDQLGAVLASMDVRRLIIAFGPARESELVGVLRTAIAHDVDVHVVPRFFDCGVAPEGPDTDDVHGIPLYRVRRAALRAPAWILKRAIDVTVAATVLLVTAPLAALIAAAVTLTSRGPVLFHQRRVGQGGHEIDVPKFRTLRVNHDSDTRWSVDDDPRVTPVGRVLRATSLDELPQLWKVLQGEMSLVGPRPERPFFVERFSLSIDGYDDRHRLPAGLTGWAQVHGLRGDTSIEERARYDNQYIEHWSLWRDLVILVRTVAEVVRSFRGTAR
jgi:exopolysaccharide biosynthesis polyprenyl glycosylphosphotransferase